MWGDLETWIKKHFVKSKFISSNDIDNLYVVKNNKEALKIILQYYELFKKEGDNFYKKIKKYKVN
jgi:predicted Rossmann-fold nucleotide-binding protein